jgi:hypothetical protein
MNEYLNENKPRFNVKKAVATAFLPVALYAATAVSKPANADTIIPLIEPSTEITLTNTTQKEIKGNVAFSKSSQMVLAAPQFHTPSHPARRRRSRTR